MGLFWLDISGCGDGLHRGLVSESSGETSVAILVQVTFDQAARCLSSLLFDKFGIYKYVYKHFLPTKTWPHIDAGWDPR